MSDKAPTHKRALARERNQALHWLENFLEGPMVFLSMVWLVLLIVELTYGLTRWGQVLGTVIWILFIGDFLLRFALAPAKFAFLRHNILTLLSLVVPALRIFRAVRAFRLLRVLKASRAARGLNLFRVVATANRGMRALGASFSRRGFGYVLALTVAVTLLGAAGMYAFERDTPGGNPLDDYGTALWWTAMIMTTMGSEAWPQTAEGRLLCLLLALYAYSVFGYVTATLATFFIGRDAENSRAEIAGQRSVNALHNDIRKLADEIARLRQELRTSGDPQSQATAEPDAASAYQGPPPMIPAESALEPKP